VGVSHGGATEWRGGKVINLGGLPGYLASEALAINDAGVVVGWSNVGGDYYATEWSHGKVIDLGPGEALAINDAGVAVGWSNFVVPESSTWAMMLIGFAGLGYAGYRQSKQKVKNPAFERR
jgi:probable HAF family extracellular repeat protein